MKMTKCAVLLTMALLVSTKVAAQQVDSGLRCNFSPGSLMVAGLVECNVVADEVTILRVTFNRGNCPARFDDPRAERAYYEFWTDTPENRSWWAGTNYHRRYKFGSKVRVEASGSCGNIAILEFEIQTTLGVFKWTVTR